MFRGLIAGALAFMFFAGFCDSLSAADFNGDGKADILWRQTNGDTYLWLTQPGSGVKYAGQDLGIVSNNYRIAGLADFNGDGKSDILWRNINGDTVLWLSRPGSTIGFTTQDLGVVSGDYQIAGVGDFNGDGKADILWRENTGDTYLWLSQPGSGVIYAGQDLGIESNDYQVAGVGDFNGDGKADILWRENTGDTYLWLSQPGSGVIYAGQDLGIESNDYQVAGVGDFNGDGKADVLWRENNGDTYLWLTQPGPGVIYAGQDLGIEGNDYQIAEVADFNGDGKADILWRRYNGDTYLWLTQPGSGVTYAGQDLGITSSVYQIAGGADCNSAVTGTCFLASNFSSLDAAVDAIGSTPGTLVISRTTLLNSSTTIPSSLKVAVYVDASIINSNGNNTLTINGSFSGPIQQIFSGFSPGHITFAASSTPIVWAEWFGASASATSAVNTPAFQAALQAGECGPPVRFGAGTYLVAGSGQPSGANLADLNITPINNPNGCPIDFGGQRIGSSVLKNDVDSYFSIISLNGFNGTPVMPFSLHDLTLDGNGANNPQQPAGDAFQSCWMSMNVSGGSSGINMSNVECMHAAFQGMQFNATQYVHAQFITHHNYSNGFQLTGNDSAGLYGMYSTYSVNSYDNGDNDANHRYDCNDEGGFIGDQYSIDVNITTSNNNQPSQDCIQTNPSVPGGVTVSRTSYSNIVVNSTNDRVGLMLDQNTHNNNIQAIINVATEISVQDINTAGTAIANNNLQLTVTNGSGSLLSLGTVYPFTGNTITGTFENINGSPESLMVIGTGYSNNTMQNFKAGDQHDFNNITYFVSGSSGGGNTWSNGTGVGDGFTRGVVNCGSLRLSDKVAGPMYGTLSNFSCGPGVGPTK